MKQINEEKVCFLLLSSRVINAIMKIYLEKDTLKVFIKCIFGADFEIDTP